MFLAPPVIRHLPMDGTLRKRGTQTARNLRNQPHDLPRSTGMSLCGTRTRLMDHPRETLVNYCAEAAGAKVMTYPGCAAPDCCTT